MNKKSQKKQIGISLVELLVGMLIGLVVLGVAGGALLASRGITGTVSDSSNIQQQASYLLRVIGQQTRQAGALNLDLNPENWSTEVIHWAPVNLGFNNNASDRLSSTSNTFTVGYKKNPSPAFDSSSFDLRDCLGQTSPNEYVKSTFYFSDDEIYCTGSNSSSQPLVKNIAEFKIRYLLQDASTSNDTHMQYVNGESLNNDDERKKVQAIEVCFVIYGDESINIPPGTTYSDCSGKNIDIFSLGNSKRKNRIHVTFRNTFQIRSQGKM